MIAAAIYARKSTTQDVSEDAKSVTRQIEHAKAYAAKKGWDVADEHIYVDDAISGSMFDEKRPALFRLLNTLKPTPPFQILVMSEESRLGRIRHKTETVLHDIIEAGVKIFYYLENRQVQLDNATSSFIESVRSFASEMEREKAQQRTHDALVSKARQGHVVGGVTYGYDNVEVCGPDLDASGRRKRLYVTRQINAAQAEVVRRIFRLYSEGKGSTKIAKMLNMEGAPAPRPRRPETILHKPSWAGSAVRSILYNPLYRGVAVWNKTRKRHGKGTKASHQRPESEWIRVEQPELRIVPEALWQETQARLAMTRASYLRDTGGKLWGRPDRGLESQYLLTGLGQCSECGGSFYVKSRSHGKKRKFFYGCSIYHKRGTMACSNGLEVPMEQADREVLETLKQDVLQPAAIADWIRRGVERARVSEHERTAKRGGVVKELKVLATELAHLAQAIAAGGELPALLAALTTREQRIKQLQQEVARQDRLVSLSELDLKRLEYDLRDRLKDWSGLLSRHVAQARQLLRKLLVGRLQFRPISDGEVRAYEFSGQATYGKLLAGLVCATTVVSPTGFEPVLQP